jgi:uncharacterized phage protein gp47/JayE
MAFQRPTLEELIARVQADLQTRIGLNGAALRRSTVGALAAAEAAAVHMLHGHLEYLARQLFPDLSDTEYLERHGSLFGITRTPAAFAAGPVVAWGVDTSVITAGTLLQRGDGAQYETDADATVVTLTAWATSQTFTEGQLRTNGGNVYLCTVGGAGATVGTGPSGTAASIADASAVWKYIGAGTAAVSVAVTAIEAGLDGNSNRGVVLSFVSPVSGVNTSTIVSVGALTGGTDFEADEGLRTRLIERMRQAPHGGSAADYIAWAKEVPGVTRAWVYAQELGAGTVTVRFVRDGDGTGAAIIPSAGEVTAVQDYIDARRPVTATVTVVAPVSVVRNFTIHVVPDTPTIRAAVQAELEDYLRREATPGGTLLISQLRAAVAAADGVTDFTMAVPSADVTHTTGQIATMGTITWT